MLISKIKERVNHRLSDYFVKMSTGEFEGASVFPENALELVSLYLSVAANCSTQEIIDEFHFSNPQEVAEQYELAASIVVKDDWLISGVDSLAHELKIPAESLFFNPPV